MVNVRLGWDVTRARRRTPSRTSAAAAAAAALCGTYVTASGNMEDVPESLSVKYTSQKNHRTRPVKNSDIRPTAPLRTCEAIYKTHPGDRGPASSYKWGISGGAGGRALGRTLSPSGLCLLYGTVKI
ncbi:hypothetical protein EVAR_33406_1 [Eumeta japonica]|uniref:Uncharacterized protein n=1 Tax=Eumeta variegata TaxID=151549 RepID=A0A4C1W3A7_EUMVA|nr:hypothetical protein EVAR_33406_1 [Eumeta japonica]